MMSITNASVVKGGGGGVDMVIDWLSHTVFKYIDSSEWLRM